MELGSKLKISKKKGGEQVVTKAIKKDKKKKHVKRSQRIVKF